MTYKIPPIFYRYVSKRDGWKGQASSLKICGIMAFLMAVFFMQAPPCRSVGMFLFIFIGYAAVFKGLSVLPLATGSWVNFQNEGIKNPGKGRPIPYSKYENAIIEKMKFEGTAFQTITFVPNPIGGSSKNLEYGFSSKEDISFLIDFLRDKGLQIEQR